MGIFAANLPEKDQMNNNQASQSSSAKIERRVVEKNRRNLMKLLYSNLFSLLPNQNPKEPLTLPEQIDEAINYIKSKESKLQKSREKKESLVGTRKRSHATSFINAESMEPKNLSIESVRSTKAPQIQIHETGSTVEVVLTTGLDNHQFIFYEIIRILDEEQADVVHAGFSTLGDTVFHVVRAEMHKSVLDFGAARITEKLNRFVNGSTRDQELQQDCFWDFELEPVAII
ncbi:transcription factor bHLH36-like [Pyrus ussuriensis x Pyrus communis]|uniref:Transcription factor bHLH36-like n=1 Tax=Pyrus ussuriensis x Pyrus communis TaxID=2448454 RepID=A0A5N5GB41_9ROSA|nr:transcription factor bHLH36-like [Pyrus ussuriensis x Pyrus communis]